MTSFQVDPDQVRAGASALKGTTAEIEALADYAQEANPDWWMWGLPGLFFAPPYFAIAQYFQNELKEVAEAVECLAEGIEDCAEDYAACDAEAEHDLTAVGGDLEG
jgi:hypothetical protein